MARNSAKRAERKRRIEDAPAKGRGIVQPVAHRKDATSEKMLALIDNLHEDNLPVQPVAQRSGIERSR
jgi:hypothetical protein